MIRRERVSGREVTLSLNPLQAIQQFFGVAVGGEIKEKPSIERWGKMFASERGDAWDAPTGVGFTTSRFPRRILMKKEIATTPTPAPAPTPATRQMTMRYPVKEYYASLRGGREVYPGRMPREWEVRKILIKAKLPSKPYQISVTKKEVKLTGQANGEGERK